MYRGRLAGRLRTLERLEPPDRRPGHGLAALLEWHRAHPSPPRDWDAFDAADPATLTGMGRLLHEARRQQRTEGTPQRPREAGETP
jgi:hypothetical protein